MGSSVAAAVVGAAGVGGEASSTVARITNLDDLELLGKMAKEDNLKEEDDDMVGGDGMSTPEAMHERLEAAMAFVWLKAALGFEYQCFE